MYSIGELAGKTGVKVPTIRYYEQQGLISEPHRTEGNQRRYGEGDLQRLSFIRHSRELGFSILAIRELIDLSGQPRRSCADAHGIASRHLAQTRAKINKLKRLERELKRISHCDAKTIGECALIESLAEHRREGTDIRQRGTDTARCGWQEGN